jgi:hypothetical protein
MPRFAGQITSKDIWNHETIHQALDGSHPIGPNPPWFSYDAGIDRFT